jgi:hypothetical protein
MLRDLAPRYTADELKRVAAALDEATHGSRNATPRTLFNLWNEAATRDRAMVALMSTKTGVFPGTPGSNTEVPRETLVTALGQRMKPLSSSMDLQPGVSHVEVAAPALGDAPFTVVGNE